MSSGSSLALDKNLNFLLYHFISSITSLSSNSIWFQSFLLSSLFILLLQLNCVMYNFWNICHALLPLSLCSSHWMLFLITVTTTCQIFSISKSQASSVLCCCCCSVAKSCLTLCNPMDYSMPGSSSSTISWSLHKFMSIQLVMLSKQGYNELSKWSCMLSCFSHVQLFAML